MDCRQLWQYTVQPRTRSECERCGLHNATQQKGRFAMRSDHPGGGQVVRCDGSVGFVSEDVSLTAWQAAATRAVMNSFVSLIETSFERTQ